MDTQFVNSTVGRKFLEYTMPELVRQLTKLNDNLEKLIPLFEEDISKSFGEMNKEIKTGLNNILRIEKHLRK